jgi:hypothetical protein
MFQCLGPVAPNFRSSRRQDVTTRPIDRHRLGFEEAEAARTQGIFGDRHAGARIACAQPNERSGNSECSLNRLLNWLVAGRSQCDILACRDSAMPHGKLAARPPASLTRVGGGGSLTTMSQIGPDRSTLSEGHSLRGRSRGTVQVAVCSINVSRSRRTCDSGWNAKVFVATFRASAPAARTNCITPKVIMLETSDGKTKNCDSRSLRAAAGWNCSVARRVQAIGGQGHQLDPRLRPLGDRPPNRRGRVARTTQGKLW